MTHMAHVGPPNRNKFLHNVDLVPLINGNCKLLHFSWIALCCSETIDQTTSTSLASNKSPPLFLSQSWQTQQVSFQLLCQRHDLVSLHSWFSPCCHFWKGVLGTKDLLSLQLHSAYTCSWFEKLFSHCNCCWISILLVILEVLQGQFLLLIVMTTINFQSWNEMGFHLQCSGFHIFHYKWSTSLNSHYLQQSCHLIVQWSYHFTVPCPLIK